MEESRNYLSILLSLLSPLLLNDFVRFAWGSDDPTWLMLTKRVFILLPVLATLMAIWSTLLCLVSVIIREKRREFLIAIFITWWDLGRAILSFWGGTFKFSFHLVAALFGLLKFMVVGFWAILQDVVFLPFKIVRNAAGNILKPGIPWIAVSFTLIWCVLEAMIFTYVTTPLVVDTFSNLTGDQFTENLIRIPLFIFMLFIVLGSYAVLSTLAETLRTRNIPAIVKICAIECVALVVEVVFLYREFVDSLVPWFAQHAAEGFELGIFGTLAIATVAWLGIRGMSWYLFACHGTPTIMAIMKGAGVKNDEAAEGNAIVSTPFDSTLAFTHKLKEEMVWLEQKGEDLLGAFILPPLQVVAAGINFCSLVIIAEHLFELPFRSVKDIVEARDLLQLVAYKVRPAGAKPPPPRLHRRPADANSYAPKTLAN